MAVWFLTRKDWISVLAVDTRASQNSTVSTNICRCAYPRGMKGLLRAWELHACAGLCFTHLCKGPGGHEVPDTHLLSSTDLTLPHCLKRLSVFEMVRIVLL